MKRCLHSRCSLATSRRSRTPASSCTTRRPSKPPRLPEGPAEAYGRRPAAVRIRNSLLPFYAVALLSEVVWIAIVPVAPAYARLLGLS